MLARLGSVSWWIGAAVAAIAALYFGNFFVEHMNCPQVQAEHVKFIAANDDALATYKRQHPYVKGILAAFDAAALMADRPSESAEAVHAIEACNRYQAPYLPLVSIGILILGLWSFAFVLGGSFLTPPKIKR